MSRDLTIIRKQFLSRSSEDLHRSRALRHARFGMQGASCIHDLSVEGATRMSSISIRMMRARTALELAFTIDSVGKAITRWGLVLVLAWIGAMKFTVYEATGIQPLVAHSPLLSWIYDFLSVRSFSIMLGFIEIGIAVLIALQSVSPKMSAVGSVLAMGLFATTLSFILSTPGWAPGLGFPALSAMPGQFLLKDIVLFGASVWVLGESLRAINLLMLLSRTSCCSGRQCGLRVNR